MAVRCFVAAAQMVEELWYAHRQRRSTLVHTVKVNNPSANSVTAKLDRSQVEGYSEVNASYVDSFTRVLVGPVVGSKTGVCAHVRTVWCAV